MRISDWSSDVCSSDLIGPLPLPSVRSTEVLRRSPIAAAGSAPSAPARRPQPQQSRPPANPPRSERPAFPRSARAAPPPAAPPAPSAVRTWLFLTSDRHQIADPRIILNKAHAQHTPAPPKAAVEQIGRAHV